MPDNRFYLAKITEQLFASQKMSEAAAIKSESIDNAHEELRLAVDPQGQFALPYVGMGNNRYSLQTGVSTVKTG